MPTVPSLITVFAVPRPAQSPYAPPCIVREMKRSGIAKINVLTWCNHEHDAAVGLLQMPSNIPCCQGCTGAVDEFRRRIGG